MIDNKVVIYLIVLKLIKVIYNNGFYNLIKNPIKIISKTNLYIFFIILTKFIFYLLSHR